MNQHEYTDVIEKLDKVESNLIERVNIIVNNQAERQAIICSNQCKILQKIDEKINGNGHPGIITRVNDMEKCIKIYNWVIVIILSSTIAFISIDVVKKYMKSGLFNGGAKCVSYSKFLQS